MIVHMNLALKFLVLSKYIIIKPLWQHITDEHGSTNFEESKYQIYSEQQTFQKNVSCFSLQPNILLQNTINKKNSTQ